MNRKLTFILLTLLLGCIPLQFAAAANANAEQFVSPDAAVAALVAAVGASDIPRLKTIIGPGSQDLLESGDTVVDRKNRQLFLELYNEKHSIESKGTGSTLLVGTELWPFPIPLVNQKGQWRFDPVAGREEIINRRIGGNELSAIDFCEDYVDIQKEYLSTDQDGDGLHEYARRFMSEPGTKNGLFWARRPGEAPSPLGPLAIQAFAEGYLRHHDGTPQPYHGYYFRILTAQGAKAMGGAKNYIGIDGHMVGGFALVAYPVRWGVSGIMSFIVNQEGVVYQKNLGAKTQEIASTMKEYEPDHSWHAIDSL